jgi:hypothetical protein
MLDLVAHPHSSIPYVHTGFSTAEHMKTWFNPNFRTLFYYDSEIPEEGNVLNYLTIFYPVLKVTFVKLNNKSISTLYLDMNKKKLRKISS